MSFTRIDANNISPSGVAAGTYTNPTITINSSGQVTDASSGQLAQGIQGLQGIIGPQGVQGLGGIQGSSGYIGSDGVQGIQGIVGSGIQGIQGIQGSGAGLAVTEYTTYVYTGNGTTTTFAAVSGLTVHTVLVVVDGVTQTPTTNYTISGSNIVLSSAPPSGSVIQLRVLGGLIGPQGVSGSGGSSVTISSIEVTDSSYNVLDDTAVNVSGGYIKITGTGFVSGCQVVVGSLVATSVSFVSSTEVRAQIPAQTAGTYTVYLTNPNGSVAIRVNGINYSSTPTWTTTSPLPGGVKNTAISIQLAASSNSTITYSLASGSTLPSGLTLSTSGLLSGTVTTITADTAYNFTIVATDQENQDTPQAFQITIVIGDPYYELVTLHLPGTGTNLATNNTFLDGSTNNFTITRNGNTTQGTFSPFSQTGWGNYFDGTGDYLTVADNAAMELGSSNFCIEFWINTTSSSQYDSVISREPTAVGSTGYWSLLINNASSTSGDVAFYSYDYNNFTAVMLLTTGASIRDGAWHHVALVRNNTAWVIYIDGVSRATQTSSITIGNITAQYWIGSNQSQPTTRDIQAYISNFRYVVGNAVYTGAFTPPTSPLAATQSSGTNINAITGTQTALLTCQANRFIDSSAQSTPNTPTPVGGPTVVAFSPFNPTASWSAATYGGSGYFDGSGDYLSVDSTAESALNLTGTFTLEFWFYRNATGDMWFFSKGGGVDSWNATNGIAYQAFIETGTLYFQFYTGSTVAVNVTAPPILQWNHFAIGRDGTTLRGWLNGSSIGTTTSTPTPPTTRNVIRVAANTVNGKVLNGFMSGLRVINGTDIYGASNTTITVPTAPPTATTNTQLLLNFTNAGIYDATGKNDLETVGNAQISTAISAKWGSGSMYFDGNGDGLYRPNTDLFNFGTGNFTIEFWLYYSSKTGYQTIASLGYSPATSTGWLIQTGNGDGKVIFYVQTSGTIIASDTGSTVNTGQWYHIAIVRNSGTTTIYRDGTSVGSGSDSTNYSTTGVFYIGGGTNTGFNGGYFNGYISDLRITKGYARYTANFTPPTAAFPTL